MSAKICKTRTIGVDPYVYLRANAFIDAFSGTEYHQAHVAAMNTAFACELYLKSLWVERISKLSIVEEDGEGYIQTDCGEFEYKLIHGHELDRIYGQLPRSLREWLANRYYDQTSSDFREILAECGSLFVDLRYLHEKSSFSYSKDRLFKLALFLKGAIEEIMKTRGNPPIFDGAQP